MSKTYLEECWLCGESKAAIKYSQSIKDPIYCGIMSYGEEAECIAEFDHHIFVVTEEMIEARKRDEKAEADMYGDMVEWMKNNPIEESK